MQLNLLFLHCYVGRESLQQRAQGCSVIVFRAPEGCAIEESAEVHSSQSPVQSAHIAANLPSPGNRFGVSEFKSLRLLLVKYLNNYIPS